MPQKYPYNIDSRPVKISQGDKISTLINLHRAVLLNENVQPFLSEINDQIDGWSALMIAARNSNTWSSEDMVKLLISAGADLNMHLMNGTTALMLAALNSRKDSTENTVKILINAGANLDLQDRYGNTALMSASRISNIWSTEQTVQILVDAGANLDLQDDYGRTALMSAILNSTSISTSNTVKILISAGAKINVQTKYGISALMFAAANHDSSSMKMLLDAGAHVNLQDHDKHDALTHLIIHSDSDKCSFNEATMLINSGANIDTINKHGYTLLSLAVTNRQIKTVKLLLEYNINVHVQDHYKRTILMNTIIGKAPIEIIIKFIEKNTIHFELSPII